MNLEIDNKRSEGGKLGPKTEANVDDLTETSGNLSDTAPLSPLVDIHACGICFQPYNDSERLPKVLSCGHTNCLACLSSWVKHGSSPFPICAVCRKITHKPVYLLPNNFQLLEVLRRMKLVSLDSSAKSIEEEQISSPADDSAISDMVAVCEQIDEHMNDVASLLESQMERLSTKQEESISSADCGSSLRMVEDSVADFLQRWESTKSCLLSSLKSKISSRECDFMSHIVEFVDSNGLFNGLLMSAFEDLQIGPTADERAYFERSGSDTLPDQAYSDFSIFGSDSHETAVSASLSSSQDGNFSGFDDQLDRSVFPHITTIDSYSYCTLCQCRLPRSFSNYQTHVLGRRHQLNCAIERSVDGSGPGRLNHLNGATEQSSEGIVSGRARSYNMHPNRYQGRRAQGRASASGQNATLAYTSVSPAAAAPTASGDSTEGINVVETPDWLLHVPQRGFYSVAVATNNGPSGNSNVRAYTNTQRRNRGGIQSDGGNSEAVSSRRSGQRPQSSSRGGNLPFNGAGRVPDSDFNLRLHRFSADDSSRWDPSDDRWQGQPSSSWDRYIGWRYP